MNRNWSFCPEIEELKKAILVDLPEDILNSNSNSKDKLSVVHKKEKDVAMDFLRRFNEAQEKFQLEKKLKERRLEENLLTQEKNSKSLTNNQITNERMDLDNDKNEKVSNNIEKTIVKSEESYQKPTEKFNRIVNLNELEKFNQNINHSIPFRRNPRNEKKRKYIQKPQNVGLKQIKENCKNGFSQSLNMNRNKMRIEFKNTNKNPDSTSEKKPLEEITIRNKPLHFYSAEEKISKETENFSFIGKVVACSKIDDLWFIDIEKFDKNTNIKLCFKAIYNMNLNPISSMQSERKIKEIKAGTEYIFEFKSAPKEYSMSYLMFLESVYPA